MKIFKDWFKVGMAMAIGWRIGNSTLNYVLKLVDAYNIALLRWLIKRDAITERSKSFYKWHGYDVDKIAKTKKVSAEKASIGFEY